MTFPALPPRLYLVVPWDLPIQHPLDDVYKDKLERSLKQFLIALDQDSDQVAQAIINRELSRLDLSSVSPIALTSTQTALKPCEVEDFDAYFEVNHVQTNEPATCMIWSLLVSYQAFLTLCQQKHDFYLEHITQQKQGFRSYTNLLSRVFDLNLE
ncbi:hypothetical protein [Acaryochloris marina]|uniref:Uncharacterized protein n=1 Tax=Acaryochloris marina (strain MBIC 11017) TaxID=329726 RepID=A8ZKP4_ACAM1|nr:hypothetical protein [Acaryochloris marina]ABW31362.1 hypothetical protein AM1_A0242 [Acaryochloris marina MBIC11017]